MSNADPQRAAGTRWHDQASSPSSGLPVPPGGADDLDSWPEIDGSSVLDQAPPEVAAGGDGTGTSEGHDPWSGPEGWWPTEPPPAPPPVNPRLDHWLRILVDVGVVVFCMVFVFLQMGPSNLLSDTTPAGGDMGAHVWGPAYLRDHLLPNFQLAGWSQDWYDGFPAYQFYMVVPSLLIVLLDWGVEGPLAIVVAALAVGVFVYAGLAWSDRRRRAIALTAAVLLLLCISLPYGVAFKLVSVSGVVTMPLSAYLFGRLSGLRFPAPSLLAAATLPFLFYRGFSIYGGNIASTLAGEFAFSMSLSLALVYLGVVFRGLETGRYRALAAVLLALTGLCHLIPVFWALAATVLAVLVRFQWDKRRVTWYMAIGAGSALVGSAFLVAFLLGLDGLGYAAPLVVLGAAVAVVGLVMAYREQVIWLAPVLAVGALLSAFWVVPFYGRRAYLNDMGWEPLPYPNTEGEVTVWEWLHHLFPGRTPEVDLRWAFCLAVIGFGVSIGLRLRAGIFLGALAVANGIAFVVLPEGRLWNARILPFYYLVVLLLAALAIAETVRVVAQLIQPWREASTGLGAATALVTVTLTWFYVALPLGTVPLSEHTTTDGVNGYAWPTGSPLQLEATPESFVKSWANWNYEGYEEKPAYREYYEIVTTMAQLGQDRGCGMTLWEYEKELDRYGTPMALMLLPYWTDGCIGSMEGLYFEASATTPFHFLMQTELSTAPSSAQRDMPYSGFDITRGVQHLQLMGVRYYMATSDQARQAASSHPDLTQVAASGPWTVYEVADSQTVVPLANEPSVVEVAPGQEDWLAEPRDASNRHFGPSVQWFQDPSRWDVALADDGPESWQRIQVEDGLLQVPDARPVPEATVTDIVEERDSISFDVDRVGSPVLVKTSYFPNWEVDGALGPWRVAPNLMVVVPTERHVELHYENTSVEWSAYTLTLLGLAGLAVLVILDRRVRQRLAAQPAHSAQAGAPGPGTAGLVDRVLADAPAPSDAGGSVMEGDGGGPPAPPPAWGDEVAASRPPPVPPDD